jgi:hypothetical protein
MPRKCQRPGLLPGRGGDCSDNEIVAENTPADARTQAGYSSVTQPGFAWAKDESKTPERSLPWCFSLSRLQPGSVLYCEGTGWTLKRAGGLTFVEQLPAEGEA